jgi:uncharacterized membrane protein YphA (DoxX/SURF4 family)
MNWKFMYAVAAIPLFGFLLFMMVIRKEESRQPWEEYAGYFAYGLLAVWLVGALYLAFAGPG